MKIFLMVFSAAIILSSCGRGRVGYVADEYEPEPPYAVTHPIIGSGMEEDKLPEQEESPLRDPERVRLWAEDIEVFRSHTLEVHPKIADSQLSVLPRNMEIRQSFEEHLDALMENLPYLSDFEIKVELQRGAAIFQDNHFFFGGLLGGSVSMDELYALRYPLRFRWFADGFYLYQSSAEFVSALNHRLIAVNGIPVAEVFQEFKRFWSVENIYDARNAFAERLNSLLVLKAIGSPLGASAENETIFSFVDQAGTAFNILLTNPCRWEMCSTTFRTIPPEPLVDSREPGELPLFLQNQGENFWFSLEDGILYVRINIYLADLDVHIAADGGAFYQAVRAALAENDVNATIIDARNNPGGYSPPFERLFRLLAESVPYGMFFYFTDEGSRSASLWAAAYVKNLGATIVGQPLGQAADFYHHTSAGATSRTVLPNSGYALWVSNGFRFTSGYGFEFEDNVFRPDVLIYYTIDDWVNNRDPLFEYVLERIGGQNG